MTGIYTGGAEFVNEDIQLQSSGLIGVGHYGDDSVWITKTHFPVRIVDPHPFEADKIICLVRNPLDVFPSYANLFGLVSHVLTPEKPWNQYEVWPQLCQYYN